MISENNQLHPKQKPRMCVTLRPHKRGFYISISQSLIVSILFPFILRHSDRLAQKAVDQSVDRNAFLLCVFLYGFLPALRNRDRQTIIRLFVISLLDCAGCYCLCQSTLTSIIIIPQKIYPRKHV